MTTDHPAVVTDPACAPRSPRRGLAAQLPRLTDAQRVEAERDRERHLRDQQRRRAEQAKRTAPGRPRWTPTYARPTTEENE